MGFKAITGLVTMAVWLATGCSSKNLGGLPYQNEKLPLEKRVEDLLQRMTREEKRALLKSSPEAATQAVWRLGIPALRTLDLTHDRQVPSAAAMGATWDPALVGREARLVAAQALESHQRVVIGPDARDFSEDPWLASRMAVAWVTGLQGDGVVAALTGFTGGDQDLAAPYEAAIEEAGLWGIRAPGDSELTGDALETDLGFRGFLMGGAGANDVDEEVRRRLRAMFGIGLFDEAPSLPPPEPAKFDGNIVLLKNERDLLPLSTSVKSIAVMGAPSLAIPADCHARVSYDSIGEAQRSDVAVVFGNNAGLLERVARVNSKVIAVLDRPERAEPAGAVLVGWGRRDMGPWLFGGKNPSGKLPAGIDERMPLGYGLSYTAFSYSNLKIYPKTARYGQLIQISLDVANTGGRDGADVVQVYVGSEKRLKAFRRVELKAGETRSIGFELDHRALSLYDSTLKTWATQPGTFEIFAGALHDSFELVR